MRILVTGGAGFICSNLVEKLLAARAGVRPSIQSPRLYYDTNVLGTLHLLEAARLAGVERFIFASSSSVYGASKTVPFSEHQHLTQTLSPYGATKIAGEFLCSTYSHLYQMRVVALRYFTVYGPRQRPDLAIHQFTRRIYTGQPIDQFGDGSTRRDYTYIDDVIQGTVAALDYDGPTYDVFNLGENQTIQLKDLILAIEGAVRKKAKINRLGEQPGDMPTTYADISKARKLLGYNPTTKFSEGLPKFVEWFLRNESKLTRTSA
jgi:UDP-glucuronate 4-epimerase